MLLSLSEVREPSLLRHSCLFSIPCGKDAERKTEYRVPIKEDTSSPSTYKQIKTWLGKCNDRHPKCRLLPGNPFLPTRLIYLDSSKDAVSGDAIDTDVKFQPRLVSTHGLNISDSRYIVLSHRRQEDFLDEAKSTRKSLSDQMRGLILSKLPPIFTDTFEVASRMGVSYVWVYSLCVVQDDPVDRKREAAFLSQIYHNAYLTVAAAVPTTVPGQGLFRHGDSFGILSERLVVPLDNGSIQEVIVMKKQWEAYAASPLVERGWCFQERELSRRIIHYTQNQVLWECHTIRASESLPDGSTTYSHWPQSPRNWPERLLDKQLRGENVEDAWYRGVEDYSLRRLTIATDKFPALAILAAVVREFKSPTCRYLAGVWEDDFVSSLAWASRPLRSHSVVTNERYSEYVAPSWSWASVAGPVSYLPWLRRKPSSLPVETNTNSARFSGASTERNNTAAAYALKTLDIIVQTSTGDPFGAVKYAVLRCTAGLLPAVLDHPRRGHFSRARSWLGEIIMLKTVNGDRIGNMHFDVPREEEDGEGVQICFCIYLDIQSWRDNPALVVLPAGKGRDEYRRVGIVPSTSRSCFASAQVKEIGII